MRRIASALLSLTLALTGCGGSDSTSGSASNLSAPESTSATANQDQVAKETSEAEAASEPKPAEPEPEPEPEPAKKDLSGLPLEEYLAAMIIEETGETTIRVGDDVPRIREGGVLVMNGEKGVYATLMLNADDHLTAGWMRDSILEDSTTILRRIYTEREDAPDKTVIQWFFPLEDVYGNTQEVPIITVSLSKETAAKFNWEKFSFRNLPQAADSYVQHQALSN